MRCALTTHGTCSYLPCIDSQLTTNGSNLRGMWSFAGASDASILEEDEIYSNDIYAILKTYGVEMARAAILREMKGIFAVYSIDVNRRHLELIADYMVRVARCAAKKNGVTKLMVVACADVRGRVQAV